MTEEEYNLLVKDLCCKLPYELKVQIKLPNYETQEFDEEIAEAFWINMSNGLIDVNGGGICYNISMHKVKPYLRSMSSMTEEEKTEFHKTFRAEAYGNGYVYVESVASYDWLDQHHFDYRGLIEKGLALEAQPEIYK